MSIFRSWLELETFVMRDAVALVFAIGFHWGDLERIAYPLTREVELDWTTVFGGFSGDCIFVGR